MDGGVVSPLSSILVQSSPVRRPSDQDRLQAVQQMAPRYPSHHLGDLAIDVFIVIGEEVDPDSKHTWYTWHDDKMAKIRNEKSNITDHYLNGLRSILWSFITNGLLILAAITQIRTNEYLDYLDDLQDEIE